MNHLWILDHEWIITDINKTLSILVLCLNLHQSYGDTGFTNNIYRITACYNILINWRCLPLRAMQTPSDDPVLISIVPWINAPRCTLSTVNNGQGNVSTVAVFRNCGSHSQRKWLGFRNETVRLSKIGISLLDRSSIMANCHFCDEKGADSSIYIGWSVCE